MGGLWCVGGADDDGDGDGCGGRSVVGELC